MRSPAILRLCRLLRTASTAAALAVDAFLAAHHISAAAKSSVRDAPPARSGPLDHPASMAAVAARVAARWAAECGGTGKAEPAAAGDPQLSAAGCDYRSALGDYRSALGDQQRSALGDQQRSALGDQRSAADEPPRGHDTALRCVHSALLEAGA
jgi:hypothetical protein